MEIVLSVPALIVTSAFPILARAAARDRARMDYALTRITEVGVILGLFIALEIWVLAPLAVQIVSGGRDHDTILALRLQGLSMPASFIVSALGFGLLSLRENRALLTANATALGVAVAASLALIGPLGAPGGGLAISIAEFVLATTLGLFLRSRVSLFVSARIAAAAPVAAAAVAAGLVLPEVAGAIAAAVLYFGVLVAMRVVPAEVIEALVPGAAARSGRA
jgi:O-antigen/teichoic acid export membrane protein